MEPNLKVLNNDRGSAMVVGLLVLAALTVIGISSRTVTTTELGIVRNEQVYRQNFYFAEAAALEAIQRLAIETNTLNLVADATSPTWINDATGTEIDFSNAANWDPNPGINQNSATSLLNANAHYAVNYKGRLIAAGSSVEIGQSTHQYTVFGISQNNGGQVIIEIGFTKEF